MGQVLRVNKTQVAGDENSQAAINALARDVEMRSKFGTSTPDNSVSGKIYFKLGSTTSGRWTQVDSIWVAD
jgi:hypothetical protein